MLFDDLQISSLTAKRSKRLRRSTPDSGQFSDIFHGTSWRTRGRAPVSGAPHQRIPGENVPMRKFCSPESRLAFLLSGLLVVPVCASADSVPVTSVERYLEVATAAERARSRLFELSRLLVPVCHAPSTWSLGVQPFPVALEAPKMEHARQIRERIIREVGAQPGEFIFTTNQFKTPYAAAGVQRGDRLVAIGDEPVPGATAAAFTKPGREAESRALAAKPERRFTARRGSYEFPIVVNAVETCRLDLYAVDSQYAYADIYVGAVTVTLPMLAGLTDADLTMVLAHEAAQRVLGNDGVNAGRWFLDAVTPTVVLGIQNIITKNMETGTRAPSSENLIEADRLALTILRPYGIGPDAYLRFLQRMQETNRAGTAPAYRVTRPLSTQRQTDLEEQIRRVASGNAIRAPQSIEPAKLTALEGNGTALLRADALTIAVAVAGAESSQPPDTARVVTKTHRWRVPVTTGFARIDDLDAVPVREEGKDRFRHYLTLPSPKAFVVTAKGGWRFSWNNANAMTLALDGCSRGGATCWLYAVDDQVVYDADPSKRIAQSGQLRSD